MSASIVVFPQKQRPYLKRDRTQNILYPLIIQREDERVADDDLLDMLSSSHIGVRKRAILALGRIGYPSGLTALTEVLNSSHDPEIRSLAAFSMGLIQSQYGVAPLLEHMEDESENAEVRARAAEALGRIASNKLAAEELGRYGVRSICDQLVKLLPDPAKHLTGGEESMASLTLTALLRIDDPVTVAAIIPELRSTSPTLRWQAANALSRIGKDLSGAVPALIGLLSEKDPIVRAQAARALGAAKDPRSVDALVKSLSDSDQRVVADAIRALGKIGDTSTVPPLLALAEKEMAGYQAYDRNLGIPPQQNLMLLLATALGDLKDARALPFLKEYRFLDSRWDLNPEVEIALAKFGESVFFDLPGNMKLEAGDWRAMAAFAQGLGFVEGSKSVSTLRSMLSGASFGKPDPRAIPYILDSLAALKAQDLREVLLDQLKASDVMIRAKAAELLGRSGDSSSPVVDALEAALKPAHDDNMNDARIAIIEAANQLGHPLNLQLLSGAQPETDYVVRRRAADLFLESKVKVPATLSLRIGKASTGHDRAYYKRMAQSTMAAKDPIAIIHTLKGQIVVDLFAVDAPITVDNFIQLANKGFYNGLPVIRVVPDFVIQGGDPRGDMNGGPGYEIRDEINLHPYGTGTVGMALSGKDTGGSQFFITHSPQPHLDGNYTVFGAVTRGLDVLNQIARGDTIQRIEIVDQK